MSDVMTEVGEFWRLAGLTPHGDLLADLESVFKVDEAGEPVIRAVWTVSPVQRLAVLAWLFLFDHRVVWTSRSAVVLEEAARGLADVLARNDMLGSRVKRFVRRAGEQEVELRSGGRVLFRAATARGLSATRLVVDQASEFGPSQLASVLPVLGGSGQVVYAS